MSIMYNLKVKKLEITKKPIEEMVDMAYHAMQDNFRWSLKNTQLDLSKEPAKIKIGRFMELINEVRDTEGIELVKGLSIFASDNQQEDWKRLRDSYKDGNNLFHSYSTLIRNNIYHIVTQEEHGILPVLMVNVEIVSVHPDAGYPSYRMNANVTKSDERKFLLRILADALFEHDKAHPLVQEARKTTTWDKDRTDTDYRMDASKVIWGFKRHKGVKIKPTSVKAFWKRNESQWWSNLKDYFPNKSDNKPYELVTYDMMIHPGWEKDLAMVLDRQIDGVAHWS